MTSFRQFEANRRNAQKSTGPRTKEGKRRSRRNAARHGLTAETVIASLEDAEDYKAFEAAVTADYAGQTAVERELVLRLASLLWRLRRATAIETQLLEIQAEALRKGRHLLHATSKHRQRRVRAAESLRSRLVAANCPDGAYPPVRRATIISSVSKNLKPKPDDRITEFGRRGCRAVRSNNEPQQLAGNRQLADQLLAGRRVCSRIIHKNELEVPAAVNLNSVRLCSFPAASRFWRNNHVAQFCAGK
jgi:hypothetical protein